MDANNDYDLRAEKIVIVAGPSFGTAMKFVLFGAALGAAAVVILQRNAASGGAETVEENAAPRATKKRQRNGAAHFQTDGARQRAGASGARVGREYSRQRGARRRRRDFAGARHRQSQRRQNCAKICSAPPKATSATNRRNRSFRARHDFILLRPKKTASDSHFVGAMELRVSGEAGLAPTILRHSQKRRASTRAALFHLQGNFW